MKKTVLITGATSGIGKETAIALAKLGATVVITSRHQETGEQARKDISTASRNDAVQVFHCDFASLDSVRTFCSSFLNTYDRIDVLINNAGTWDFHRRESRDGIENIFAVNYLAPFLITNLLLGRLIASAPARIVSVVSGLHWGTIRFDDIESRKQFSGFKAYRQSKLALLLFSRILAQKLSGTGVTVNCADPGMVATNLGRDAPLIPKMIFKVFGISPAKGAATSVFLASSEEIGSVSGECFRGRKIARTSRNSNDLQTADKLWTISEHYLKNFL